MSLISNVHTVGIFTAGESKPLTSQRLAKVGFKKTKDNPSPLPSVCASVPFLAREEVMGNIEALLPHVSRMLEGVQDQIIRSLYEGSKGLRKEVRDGEISVAQCIAFLNAESAGNRMSAEAISAWFTTSLQDSLIVLIAGKLGFAQSEDEVELTSEQHATCLKHAKVYGDLLGQLAGKNLRKSNWTQKQWAGMETALSLATEDDMMAGKLADKMQAISEVPEVEDLLEL